MVDGAKDEADALKKLKADPNKFKRPVVSRPTEDRVIVANIMGRPWIGAMGELVRATTVYYRTAKR